MYTSNNSHNRNYSNRISSSQHRQSNHPRTGFSSISSNPEEIFQYKGSNKQQWAKLQNKIKQKMMAQNIWYLEDKDEVGRRSTPAPPISTIPPLPSEKPNQREDRLRLQKLYDDHRRKRESKFEDYEELFALDYGKAIAVHYHFLSPTLHLDLDREIEEIDPPTINVAIHYRVLKTHLANKWGPNSAKDSNEATSKLALLRVDERGADVYLAAVFSIIDLLTKTPITLSWKQYHHAHIYLVHSLRPPLPNMLCISLRTKPPKTSGHYNIPTTKSKTTAPPTTTSRTRLSSHSWHPALRTTQVSPTSTNKLTTPPAPGQTCAKTSNPASKTRQGEHHGTHRLSRAEHAPTTPTGPPLSAHPPHLARTATPAKNKKTTNTEPTTPLRTANTNGTVTMTAAASHTHRKSVVPAPLQLHRPPTTNTHAPTATRTTGLSIATAPNAASAKLPSPPHHSERPTTTHTTATNNPPNALASTYPPTQPDLAPRQQRHF
jgi:hypothetical protein